MTTMTVYDIQIIKKDKTIVEDRSGPHYGSYLELDPALKARCEVLSKDENVFTVIVKSSQVMA